jgi:hypothetical protein
MLKGGMCSENRVVWLHNRVCECRRRVDAELKLALLAVVRGEPLKDERTKTRTRPATKGMEDKEALKTRAVVSQTANSVYHVVDLLLPNCIMAPCV